VVVHEAAVLGLGGRGDVERVEPGDRPLRQRQFPAIGVEELAPSLVGFDLGGFVLGCCFRGESGDGAESTVVFRVTRPPQILSTLLNKSHE
jgi:hypothetical protein